MVELLILLLINFFELWVRFQLVRISFLKSRRNKIMKNILSDFDIYSALRIMLLNVWMIMDGLLLIIFLDKIVVLTFIGIVLLFFFFFLIYLEKLISHSHVLSVVAFVEISFFNSIFLGKWIIYTIVVSLNQDNWWKHEWIQIHKIYDQMRLVEFLFICCGTYIAIVIIMLTWLFDTNKTLCFVSF